MNLSNARDTYVAIISDWATLKAQQRRGLDSVGPACAERLHALLLRADGRGTWRSWKDRDWVHAERFQTDKAARVGHMELKGSP